jgi:hypothetical protein
MMARNCRRCNRLMFRVKAGRLQDTDTCFRCRGRKSAERREHYTRSPQPTKGVPPS